MISEKWNLNFDIRKLQEHLKEVVIPKEITRQSRSFGGWSVLSSNGDYKDGWWMGYILYKNEASEEEKAKIRSEIGSKKSVDFVVETEICSGYMKEVIDTVRSHNLSPSRARIICLTAESSSSWHTDSPAHLYAVRLHVPIITNEGCFFETRDEREHLAADGSAYFLYVNKEHRVVNHGTEDRYHLVMDIRDTMGVTQHHRMADFKPQEKV